MKKSIVLAATAVAALSTAAMADITVNLGSLAATGGQFTAFPTITGVTGTCTSIVVSFEFNPTAAASTAGSWASDAGVNINGFQWGGYNALINGATTPVDYWSYDGPGSAAAGTYTDTRTDIPAGLLTPSTLDVSFGNGWSTSPLVNYGNITVTFVNLTAVAPTPGAAAMLGLGGLAAFRRRRA